MLPIIAAIAALGTAVKGIIDSTSLPKNEAKKIAAQVENMIQETSNQIIELAKADLESKTKIIVAEAQGESWIQRTWRPIVAMGCFLVVFGRGFSLLPPLLFGETEMKLMEMLFMFMGGYAGGRTIEKSVGSVAEAISKRIK